MHVFEGEREARLANRYCSYLIAEIGIGCIVSNARNGLTVQENVLPSARCKENAGKKVRGREIEESKKRMEQHLAKKEKRNRDTMKELVIQRLLPVVLLLFSSFLFSCCSFKRTA